MLAGDPLPRSFGERYADGRWRLGDGPAGVCMGEGTRDWVRYAWGARRIWQSGTQAVSEGAQAAESCSAGDCHL